MRTNAPHTRARRSLVRVPAALCFYATVHMCQPHNPRDFHGHSLTGVETAAGFGLLRTTKNRRKTYQNDDFRVLTRRTHVHGALSSAYQRRCAFTPRCTCAGRTTHANFMAIRRRASKRQWGLVFFAPPKIEEKLTKMMIFVY